MIKATYSYFTDEARPRLREIICGSEFWLALLTGLLFGAYGDAFLSSETKVGDVIAGLLTYSAIALGFCVAGLTIALTLAPFQKKEHADVERQRDGFEKTGRLTTCQTPRQFVCTWRSTASSWIESTRSAASLSS